ncbi:hypothetical protein Tco_0843012 [Tanacetum coccineum]|uniref:Retroviral polymerase SH3-like domain-containing protein n=1 Tax=Tanacetum coccineum TaxID=301880 RepID=A0ABQ5B0V6_9ASTR
MYAVKCTKPDVAFAQNITSRFQQNPGELHWTAVKNILKYLRNTKDMFLVYGENPSTELRVECYCDAGFKTDRDDTKSQTGYVFVLNRGAVDWKSSKQSTIAMSTTESEYIAASEAAMEAVWIRKFISGLGIVPTINEPINMYCDNSAAVHYANEPGVQRGAIYYLRKYHYVRESVVLGEIKILKVHTYNNLADPFTKALSNRIYNVFEETMKPFGCLVTILNTRDYLGKFNGKADEEFFDGYSVVSKAIRVFNRRTRIVEETLNIRFLENAPNVKGNGPDCLFDVDSLTISMNYVPVVTGNQTNGIVGTKDNIVARQAKNKKEPAPEYILIPFCTTEKSVHLRLVNLRCMYLYFTLCTKIKLRNFYTRLHSNLLINRTEYTQHIPNQTTDIQELTRKGTMRINERGFETIGVAGIGNESLYRAVSRGLMGDEATPIVNAYGMWAVDPSRVLKALAESLSIRIMVFNAKDEILTELLPTPDAEIEFTAYVLCVPTISNVTKAYALEAALPILTPQPTNNNAPEEVLRQNRIFSVNFDLTLSKFEIVQAQVIVKKMIKQKDNKFEMYFVREMLATP